MHQLSAYAMSAPFLHTRGRTGSKGHQLIECSVAKIYPFSAMLDTFFGLSMISLVGTSLKSAELFKDWNAN